MQDIGFPGNGYGVGFKDISRGKVYSPAEEIPGWGENT
jgi:hypothetical protein